MGYTDLCDNEGRLLARYDPVRRLLKIQRRGQITYFDLDDLDRRAAAVLLPTQPANRLTEPSALSADQSAEAPAS